MRGAEVVSLVQVVSRPCEDGFQASVRRGLLGTPRRLPAECFYDDVGSALFEAITVLPEYGLTRADLRLLRRHGAQVAARVSGPLEVVELGSGGGRKARALFEAGGWPARLRYRPVDVSKAALDECAARLAPLRGVEVLPLQEGYLDGLETVAGQRRPGTRLLVLFLGSNLGNFERAEARAFLAEVRARLRPGDAVLASVDLEKDEKRLLAAYDDPTGVTAAFNRNALGRLNRELGADFDLRAFHHRVRYDPFARRIEMHLLSETEARVRVKALGLDLRFAPGEGLWTESSHKFAPGEIEAWGRSVGFCPAAEWVDLEWLFSLNLLLAA
jgi:dimethylhistidine N-methyltransferase